MPPRKSRRKRNQRRDRKQVRENSKSPGNGNSASPSVRSIRRKAWLEFFDVLEPLMDEVDARMKASKLAKPILTNQVGGMAEVMGLFLLFCFTAIFWLINFGRGPVPETLRQILEVFFACQNQ